MTAAMDPPSWLGLRFALRSAAKPAVPSPPRAAESKPSPEMFGVGATVKL